jgi:Mg-chelatase subunit ChlD
MVADTIDMKTPISKNVECSVDDIPSIAYLTYDVGGTVAHIGYWLYNRNQMEEWLPAVKHMNDADMLALSVGMINGAIALDMIAKSTSNARSLTIYRLALSMRSLYSRNRLDGESAFYVFGDNSESRAVRFNEEMVSEEIKYLSSAIHDILGMKSVMHSSKKSSGWVIFPILMFRTFFDGDFAVKAKINIEHEDSINNLVHAVTALRCFSASSSRILDVKNSVGINVIRALLESISDSYSDNIKGDDPASAALYMADDLFTFYQEIVENEENEQNEGGGDKKKDKDKEDGDGEGGDSDLDNTPNSHVKEINALDSSAPVNEKLRLRKVDEKKANKREDLAENKKARMPFSKSQRDETEKFMQAIYNPDEVKFRNTAVSNAPTIYFDSIDDYCAHTKNTKRNGRDYSGYRETVMTIDRDIDKTSLRNLFMARTMDIEKSQPARSGIALIPTRIVNMFTDEKMFSPLPEESTERDSEVILLVDASGSMRGRFFKFKKSDGSGVSNTLVSGVMGVASALLDGFKMSNIRCGVYAHTTFDTNAGEAPIVIKIADETTRNALQEFLDADNISNENNGDSFAIEEVVKHFVDDGKEHGKTLIVLSDGQPACDSYHGNVDGDKETKMAVDTARESGIAVYSISLTKSVVRYNDYIYGEKYNICPADEDSDTLDITSTLQNIVKVVAKDAIRSANNVLTQG